MSHPLNPSVRRRFLRTSLGAGAAVLAGARLAPATVLGANDRIRIGVIGTGGRARGLMRQLKDLPGQELVAVSDVYEPRMQEAAAITEGKAVPVADYRQILDDKNVDAVLIGAPDHWHKPMTLDALAAGKDIFLEKPVSHALAEGEEMTRAVEASRQVVQTGTQQRSWEHYLLGKQIVDSGKLGRITFVNSYWYQLATDTPLPPVDLAKLDWKRWLGPGPDQPFDRERFFRWRHFKASGGGMLTDLLTHWIDVVHWYLDVDAPVAATTTGRRYRMKSWDWPDAATATLEYPGEFMVTHTGSFGSSVDDGGLEFRGDQATLKIDRERLLVFREGPRPGGWRNTPEPEIHVRSLGDGSIAHLRNWLDCIRSRKTPNAPMRVGHQAVRAAHIANAALNLGAGVRYDARTGKIERA
jgi:predicted dehydrogenase